MFKSIVFDIGGIILDDSIDNLSRVFGKDMNTIYKKVYSGNFKKCLLGELSMSEYAKEFVNDSDYEDICRMLNSDNQKLVTPLILENFDYICKLKEKGYKLYILSNLTKQTYDYLNSIIDLSKWFDGAIYSYKVGMLKPDKRIFELLKTSFDLDLNETIFFDDKEKNVNAAIEEGIFARVFKTINDVEEAINNKS